MRLSCLPVSLYPALASRETSLREWFQMAERLGLDGADLSVAHITSRRPAALKDLAREASAAGVELPILVTYTDFTHPDAGYRARQVDELRAWIEAAAQLGVAFLRVTAGQAHPDVTESDGLRWAVEGMTSCLAEAEAAGIRLLFENHTRGSTWQLNDFTQPAGRFLEVVRRTRGTGLAVLFDTANNLVLRDDPAAVLDEVIDRVGAVHLSDLARPGSFEHVVVGTGAAPLQALLGRLSSAGFDGWISIEEASRTGPAAFRQAAEFADRAWVDAGGTARIGRMAS